MNSKKCIVDGHRLYESLIKFSDVQTRAWYNVETT